MIIFLYGPDTFRSRRKLDELKEKFIREIDASSRSLSLVDGQAATLKELAEKIGSGSLFAKKRMIVIERLFQNKKDSVYKELAEYLKKTNNRKKDQDNILIFWDEEMVSPKAEAKKLFSFLLKQDYVQEFAKLDTTKTLSFLKKEAEQYGKTWGPGAASLLISLTGGDLWSLSRETKKLAFSATGKTISQDNVKELTSGAFGEDIFALTDAISAKNRTLASRLLEEQYAAGLEPEYILAMLTRQFKILLQIKTATDSGLNPSAIPTKLKLHPFVVKKGALAAKNFTLEILKSYLNRLIKLDGQNKTGTADIKTELTLFVALL